MCEYFGVTASSTNKDAAALGLRYEQRGDEAESVGASATCQSEPYVPLSQAEIDAMTIPKSLLFEDLVEVCFDDMPMLMYLMLTIACS